MLKLKRGAAELGGKAKKAAKKAAKKIGKSSVGRAVKGVASSAVGAVTGLPGRFKKSKSGSTVENAGGGTSIPVSGEQTEVSKKSKKDKKSGKKLKDKLKSKFGGLLGM